ncbi:MAG: macro domain-containing protein [Spirochaetia bacterium]|nr:macro domain-containing protein [Spirochaetia bacterium]
MNELIENRLYTTTGDLTEMPFDILVNAANSSLLGGMGVDGAIHKAGGPQILAECRAIRKSKFPAGLPAGEAVETTAGSMPADYVIHTVGPVWNGGNEKEKAILYSAYMNSLLLGKNLGGKSIGFPSISTGAYGFPKKLAAETACRAIFDFITKHDSGNALMKIFLVFFHTKDEQIFQQVFTGMSMSDVSGLRVNSEFFRLESEFSD